MNKAEFECNTCDPEVVVVCKVCVYALMSVATPRHCPYGMSNAAWRRVMHFRKQVI